jgi:hypothetical protein
MMDGIAQALATAARSARYGKRAALAPVRAFEADAQSPMMQPFVDIVTRAGNDPGFRDRALTDPIGVLREAGIDAPPEVREAISTQLRSAINGPVSSGQAWSRGLEAPTADVYARPWGVVIELNSQAVTDLTNGANGIAGVLAIVAAACGASGAVPCAAVAGILGGALAVMSSVVALMNRGNGVVLTIPWTSFLPLTVPVVVPTPR